MILGQIDWSVFIGFAGLILTIITTLGGVVGWLITRLQTRLKESENRIREIELDSVRKGEALTYMKTQLQKIERIIE